MWFWWLQLVESNETDTALTLRPLRNTSRVFKNDVAKQIVEYEREHMGKVPHRQPLSPFPLPPPGERPEQLLGSAGRDAVRGHRGADVRGAGTEG